MTTNKYMGFAAPYRSKTFNDKENLVFGQSGVVSGGAVTQSGLVATIAAPFTFIQKGLIVTIPDVSLSLTVPSALAAPYFIAVSVSSSIQNTAEVITPILIKRPQDMNANVVLVAEWDGVEWRNLPKLQIAERVAAVNNQNLFTGFTGVCAGMNITQDSTHFYVASGSLIGRDGMGTTKVSDTTLFKTAAPATVSQAYDRIDPIIFRKPTDSPYRIGTIKKIVGPSFVGLTGTYAEAFTSFGAATVSNLKTDDVPGSTDSVTTYLEGTTLKAKVFNDTLTEVSSFTVAIGVIDYQFVGDFDGYLNFVYTSTGTSQTALNYIKISTAGVTSIGPSVLYSSPNLLYTPEIVCSGNPTSYQFHIAVCKAKLGTAREIGYVRLASDGVTLNTNYTTWLDLSANLQQPSLAKDDDDSLLFLGFNNVDTGRAYLQTFDAGTPTSSTPPTSVGSAVELQLEVYNTASTSLMPTTGAKGVRIIRTDNKETFVTWMHPLPTSGQYGVAVYNYRYKSLFGYKALMFDSTDVISFSSKIDGMNNLYVVTANAAGTSVVKNVYDLETATRVGTQDAVYTSTGIGSVSTHFCPRGDLFVAAGKTSSAAWSRMTAGVKTTLRDQELCPTDTYLGYYRISDGMLAVSDTVVGDHPAVKRLYEFNNLFGAASSVAWAVSVANTLVTSNIIIRFLNRQSTYTVTAINTVVPNNYVIYTEVPDADATATLTTYLEPFGAGILDRVGKSAVPLFWNIGGVLYSNFSPFSFKAGESGQIGGTISDQLIAWLGCGVENPDATNHGYSSTFYVLQNDSINTAIGKLDTAIDGVQTALNVYNYSILPLTVSTSSIAVTFGAPKASASFVLVGNFSNITDADPMYQPHMITGKTINGFTVSWQAELDTGNYQFEYFIHGV